MEKKTRPTWNAANADLIAHNNQPFNKKPEQYTENEENGLVQNDEQAPNALQNSNNTGV